MHVWVWFTMLIPWGHTGLLLQRGLTIFTMVSCFCSTTMQPLDIQYHASGPNSQVSLSETFFATWCVVHKGGIASILQGLMAIYAKSNQHNATVVDELREQLSKRVSMIQQNLAAVNLQRCQEHTIPGYNAWRGYWDLSQLKTLVELSLVLTTKSWQESSWSCMGHLTTLTCRLGPLPSPS